MQSLANRKRPAKPKVLQGAYAADSDTNKHDGIDCANEAQIFRGNNSSYAIPRDAVNSDLRLHGTSFLRLFGDEFAANAESSLYLCADLTSAISGTSLTNNGTVTFVSHTLDDESPAFEYTVANFVSASSQYLSLATEASVQVGTGAFMAKIEFNISTLGAKQTLFSYGSHVASKGYWEIGVTSANKIFCEIWDATNTATITDTQAGRFQDGLDHCAIMLIDKTLNFMFLYVDGILIGSVSIASVTGTLTVAGESFYIGALRNSSGTITDFLNGRAWNFHLIKAADYNAVGVLNTGVRESVASGTFTAPTVDSSKRLNNKFGLPDANSSYFTTIVNLEDGEYEIQEVLEYGASSGKVELYIDDSLIRTAIDTYNGSTTHNNLTKTKRIKITSGVHRLKIKINGKNASSAGYAGVYQWITLIKRRGHEYGGADKILLLGDEINEIDSDGNLVLAANTSGVFNNLANRTTGNSDDLDYNQGVVYLRAGVYRVDLIYGKDTTCAKIDLYFGVLLAISALDSYNGSATWNNVKSVFVRLQQGRTPIKIQANGKNGSATDYQVNLQALRLERVAD